MKNELVQVTYAETVQKTVLVRVPRFDGEPLTDGELYSDRLLALAVEQAPRSTERISHAARLLVAVTRVGEEGAGHDRA